MILRLYLKKLPTNRMHNTTGICKAKPVAAPCGSPLKIAVFRQLPRGSSACSQAKYLFFKHSGTIGKNLGQPDKFST